MRVMKNVLDFEKEEEKAMFRPVGLDIIVLTVRVHWFYCHVEKVRGNKSSPADVPENS
jgi:hypothetical protein